MKPNTFSTSNSHHILRTLIAVAICFGFIITASAVLAAPTDEEVGIASRFQDDSHTPGVSPASLLGDIAPDHVTITDAHPGFYIENGNTPLSPASYYQTDGSYRFWMWSQLQSGPSSYTFSSLDYWITQQLNAGYGAFGISMGTYTNRYVDCIFSDAIFIPEYVQDGPDGVRGTADDPIIQASNNDTRNCDGDGNNNNDPWYLIDYDDPYYLEQYKIFIEALADYIASHPEGHRFKWIATGTGKDGETKAVDGKDVVDADLTSEQWIGAINQMTDFYVRAFSNDAGQPQVQVLVQNAPFHLNSYERRDAGAYAASRGAGSSINQMSADFDNTHSCAINDPLFHCTGMWDPTRNYSDTVPIAFEAYGYKIGTENEFYWAMARALDAHADIIRLSAFWNWNDWRLDTSDIHTIAEWTSKHAGTGVQLGEQRPPSIWSRAREHKYPLYLHDAGALYVNSYPPVGNAEFYLTQLHSVSGGTTIPVTDDNRITLMGWGGVDDKPWHYNEAPLDATLQAVGKFDTNGANGVQVDVDPAYSTRRSDQVSGNYGFFYNADDGYISPQVALHGVNEVIVTITYLDTGNDRWQLKYDGVNGETEAELYALQNWDIRTGLAIDGGLPTTGVQSPRPDYVQKTDSGEWKTATFLIEDGHFGNRLAGDSDFYIDSRSNTGGNDGDEYIHHVNVERLDKKVVQNLRINHSGDNLVLTWDAAPGPIDHYEIWRSESMDFDPGAGSTLLDSIPDTGPHMYTDMTSAVGDPAINHGYIVLAVQSDGHYSHYQPRKGEFGYGFLIP